MITQWNILIHEEQVPQEGEDALLCIAGENASLIASFDGCGGSGGRKYPLAENWTGARLGARTSAQALGRWFDKNDIAFRGTAGKSGKILAEEWKTEISVRLKDLRGAVDDGDQLVISRSAKQMPTTLAAVLTEAAEKNRYRCLFFWAGDSRAYVFPVGGLQQMTQDDISPESDPFDNLTRDGVLRNYIREGENFTIHVRERFITEPCLVLTATDGCFSYYPSPMLLEGVLLETMMESNSPNHWQELLRVAIGGVASDDYTMQISILGFQNFSAVKTAYSRRWEIFRNQFAALPDCLRRGDKRLHRAMWEEYKAGYLPDWPEQE